MFYEDNHIKIYNKDCRFMSELPDESVQMVCTSPPYWGLRKYSGEQDLIWGDNHCEHQWANYKRPSGGGHPSDSAQVGAAKADVQRIYNYQAGFCSLCGAWKGAYGLEPTPEMYIEHTIEILREIRRVLRKDGVVFWNIGDSYNSGGISTTKEDYGGITRPGISYRSGVKNHPFLKPKDLCLIPFRVAIACQEDGWWVRSVIIWSKPNPMPESVTDRPTESHEYILMLTKSARYYWDQDSVRTKFADSSLTRVLYPTGMSGKVKRQIDEGIGGGPPQGTDFIHLLDNGGANLKSVWTFPTKGYPEAHFAVFPEKLPEICIKAATPEVGCCSKCGAPWERIIESKRGFTNGVCNVCGEPRNKHIQSKKSALLNSATMLEDGAIPCGGNETLGWQPTCKCNADKVPSIVLDPFAGAGTTLWVAKKLNRRAVGYEISKEYCDLALDRNRQQVLC